MALLSEYALTPDIFDSTSYSNDEVGSIRLDYLKEALLNEGLVRNLRDGNWFSLFSEDHRPWHKRGKELLKKLRLQGRLRCFPPSLPEDPTTDTEWCKEALESHLSTPLTGIMVSRSIAEDFSGESLVSSIDRLSSTPWWAERSPSVRLMRTFDDYRENLRLVLQCANSIMFIDQYLDPCTRRYQDFIRLLGEMRGREKPPSIEVHRSIKNRLNMSESEWKSLFRDNMADSLKTAGLSIEVFIWDDFHDRYVISDLIGIEVPNGFDTTTDPRSITTWTRLGRKDRDDIQREFDPAANRHGLKYRFVVP